MSNYIYTNDGLVNADELAHYGVPGMKWGHRKNRYAGVSIDGSKRRAAEKARQQMILAKRNKRAADKAYDKSYNKAYGYSSRHLISQFIGKKAKKESDRRLADAHSKATAANKAKDQYKAAKKAYKFAKKMANIEAKAVKEKYVEQYRKGASLAGKIYGKLTNSDRYYGEMMYALNNGAYKESASSSKNKKR